MSVSKHAFRHQVEAAIRAANKRADTDCHMGRYVLILDMIRKIAKPGMKIIDVASSGQIFPALHGVLGLTEVTTTNVLGSGNQPHETLTFVTDKGGTISCPYDRFDIEKPFPYAAETFDLAIFTEVLEHITRDPMHTLSEINRVTRIGGWIMLETPNCSSLRSVIRVIRGKHPQIWSPYSSQAHRDRHNREYTPKEVTELLTSAGYKIHELRTANGAYTSAQEGLKVRASKWVANRGLALLSLLAGSYVRPSYRGEATFVTAQKIGSVSNRFPSFLYLDY